MSTYHFEKVFQYTLDLIWDKFHEKPDNTTYSPRNGFTIIWGKHALYVYALFINNMVIIEYNDNYNKQYYTAFNIEELYQYINKIINGIKPSFLH